MSKFILVKNISISDATDEGMITIELDRMEGESLEYDIHVNEAVTFIKFLQEKVDDFEPPKGSN